MVAITSQATS